MKIRTLAPTIGVGIATFLVVSGLVTELVSSWIEFSVFVGILVGFVTGVVTASAAGHVVQNPEHGQWYPVVLGLGTFGYAVLAFAAVRYAVASTRSILSVEVIVAGSIAVALAVVALISRSNDQTERARM